MAGAFNKMKSVKDAGWGLIFRLNDLWRDVERLAVQGSYDDWNFKLDRIWCNLLYRNKMVIERDKDNKIISIKLSNEDDEEKAFLDKQINNIKLELKLSYDKETKTYNKKKVAISRRKLYNALMTKDVWVRKLMQKLDLYLKETEYDPARAIYGG